MRVLLEVWGASQGAARRIKKLLDPMGPLGVAAGPWAVPDADIVVLLEGSAGEKSLRRTSELRRCGFPGPIIVLSEARPAASTGLWLDAGAAAVVYLPDVDDVGLQCQIELLTVRDELDDPVTLSLVPGTCEVRIGEACIALKDTGFSIFAYLAARRPHWARTLHILRDVFPTNHDPNSSIVRVHVHGIRERLEECTIGLGQIVEGKERRGFRINLRAEKARMAIAHLGATSGTYARVGSILLVEDDPIVSAAFDRYLRARGLEVTRAFDCAGARVQRRTFDWALIDVGLPDGDGIALGAELVHLRRVASVTFMSARATTDDEARARAIGPLIPKSRGIDEVVAAMCRGQAGRERAGAY